jgi:dTDP-glucose 4,6-dehydratase
VKFIQISTDEVYGSLGPVGQFTEENPLLPNSPYAASKASADMLVRSFYKTYGFPMNITRCSNNYGENQFPEKLIPLMISHAKKNRKLPIYGNGMQVRDWIHVEDHCRAIDLVLHNGLVGEIYNIGSNNELRNVDLVKMILSGLGKSEKLIEYVKDRLGHDYRYAIDSTKLRISLGWEPKVNFEDALINLLRHND